MLPHISVTSIEGRVGSGWLLIAEVKIRLDPGNGGATPNDFIRAVTGLGFALRTHVRLL